MLKFTKRFAGSYKAESNGYTFNIETHEQYTGEDGGKGWVYSISEDFSGDCTSFCKTKKEAIQYAMNDLELILSGEITIDRY